MDLASQNAKEESQSNFAWRSEVYAWSVVGLLTVAFTFSMIDRMILTLLVDPIKADFGISDTEISLLHGLAFTLLYVICGLPLGRLADRYSRRAIAGVSIFFWSFATVLCGAASNFIQLFLARVGVGVGEAGLSPAANSLIADYFPPERLARPIAYFSIGGSAGAGIAYIFGGAVVDYVTGMGPIAVPLFGEIRPWQAAFFVVGLPGMALAFLFALVREPERSGRATDGQDQVAISEVFSFMVQRKSFFVAHFAAAAFAGLAVLALHSWMPTFLIRNFGLTPGEVGGGYGLVVLIGGVSGLITAGWLSDYLAARGLKASHIVVARGYVLVAIIPAILAPFAPTFFLSLLLAGIGVFGLASAIALTPVALQIVVPNEMRGLVYAIYLLILSLVGYAIGPTFVALITDLVFKDEMMVGASIAIVAAIGAPLSAIAYSLSRRAYNALVETSLHNNN